MQKAKLKNITFFPLIYIFIIKIFKYTLDFFYFKLLQNILKQNIYKKFTLLLCKY